MSETQGTKFWDSMLAPLDFEVGADIEFVGTSGIRHQLPVVGHSFDESTFLLVVPDPDPIKATLIGSDLKSANSDKNFIVVRPTIGDAKEMILSVGLKLLELGFNGDRIAEYVKESATIFQDLENVPFEEVVRRSEGTIFEDELRAAHFAKQITGVSLFESGVQIIREAFLLEIGDAFKEQRFDPMAFLNKQSYSKDIVSGVCALPLHKIAADDWDQILNSRSQDLAEKFMKEIGFFQYFRPPIDQAGMGLAEHGINTQSAIEQAIEMANNLGHKVDEPELLPSNFSPQSVVDELTASGLAVQGELEIELSEEGKKKRMKVQFQPREGFFYKILRHLPHLKAGIEAVREAKKLADD